MRLLFLVVLFLVNFLASAGDISNMLDRLFINGNYFGENLVVINPLQNNRFAVESVEVNGNKTSDEINSSVFEIDLSVLGLNQGDSVNIVINYFSSIEKPIIYNPEVLESNNSFSFETIYIDKKTNKLVWTTNGLPNKATFEIEQYRWEKWVRINSLCIKDSISLNTYSCATTPYSGKNMFRVKFIDSKGNIVYSNSVKMQSKTPEIMLAKSKVDNQMLFTGETMYQIYNEEGSILLSGVGSQIDMTSLPSGKYWVNYDNKTELVKKK